MRIRYADVRPHFGDVERLYYDPNDSVEVDGLPAIKNYHNTDMIEKFGYLMAHNIIVDYMCKTSRGDMIEVQVPLFVFNSRPKTNLEKIDSQVVDSDRHHISIDHEFLTWKRGSVYVDNMVYSTYRLDSLIFMNKYIFGKPWYDIIKDCNVKLTMSLTHEN